jgi:hypothetical protein
LETDLNFELDELTFGTNTVVGVGTLTVIDKTLDAVAPLASRTTTVNGNVPPDCGLPVMRPSVANERPGGNDPEKLHEYGVDPPLAPMVAE